MIQTTQLTETIKQGDVESAALELLAAYKQ